mmetsp:Transcript_57407/g.122092  ORF Transcript_57407/g.122092 Transcript_57407/m.122092 type:complete len:483 (+) Transcript_57407:296-1744(+)
MTGAQNIEAPINYKNLTVDEALHFIPWGRFQWLLFATCGIGYAAEIIEMMLMSFALPELRKEWDIDNLTVADASMWSNIGVMIGAGVWGIMADWLGRRVVFISSVAITFLFGMLGAFAPTFELFVASRFMVGMGIGGNLAVDFALFMEFVPLHMRQQVMMMLTMWGVGGVAVIAIAAWALIDGAGWRWYIGVLSLPSLVLLVMRLGMPESPSLLYESGRVEEALQSIKSIAHKNGFELPEGFSLMPKEDAKDEFADLQGSAVIMKSLELKVRRSLVPLSPENFFTTIKFAIAWFSLSFAYGGFTLWLPSLLTDKGIVGSDIYTTYLIMVLGEIPSVCLSTYMVYKGVQKRYIFCVYMLGCAGSMGLTALVTDEYGIRVVLAISYFFMVSSWACLYVLTPEAYPATCRGTASGVLRIAGSVANSFKGKVGAKLLSHGMYVPLWTYGAVFLVGMCVAPLLPDSTNKRVVERQAIVEDDKDDVSL